MTLEEAKRRRLAGRVAANARRKSAREDDDPVRSARHAAAVARADRVKAAGGGALDQLMAAIGDLFPEAPA